jgi:PAS domain S-box-containing protein
VLFEKRLQANGLNLTDARQQGVYIPLNAAQTLAKFMVDGQPSPERFAKAVGSQIRRAAQDGRQVRAFGELVALLVAEGNEAAAIRLETLWNALLHDVPTFSLFCAYPMQSFTGDGYQASLIEICKQHSHVIPTEQYMALTDPDERLRAIALLQQKADSLESEVAERLRVEERLRISENRYRRLFEASTDGILLVDPLTFAITDANPAVTTLLGIPREHLLGRELWQIGLLENRQAVWQAVRVLQKQQTLRYETLPLAPKDGKPRFVEVVSTLYQANGHQVIQWNLRDITARKQAEEALQASQKELETQRETFIGMITHELRTPLTSLKGNIQLAQRRLTHLLGQEEDIPTAQQQTLEAVLSMLSRSQQQLRVQSRLINDLLDVTSIQEDKLALHLAPCDLGGLVYETVQDAQAGYPSRLITLDLPEQDPLLVQGDRDRLQQVLSNYLTNALKFSPEAEPVHVRVVLEAGCVRVLVQDHGPGLTREQQARIWERFYQSPLTPIQSGSMAGLGLGLYICQHLISSQQGQVGLESTPGHGATFWFRLPLLSS